MAKKLRGAACLQLFQPFRVADEQIPQKGRILGGKRCRLTPFFRLNHDDKGTETESLRYPNYVLQRT